MRSRTSISARRSASPESEHRRIGELLIAEGFCSAEVIDRALEAQAVHGGRLGTCLIEQYAIGLDDLAGALARQHDMPVALQRHFDQADPAVQQRLGAETAAQWRAVPLGRLPGDVERIAVAVLDPLGDDALYELSDALGAEVVAAIAPQLRILYHLERVYGIARPNRFKRGSARPGSDPGHERRGYVKTLSDAEPAADAVSSLGRIAVRRIQVAPTASAVVEPEPDIADLDGALRAIRRAGGRRRVGSLVVSALEQGFDTALSAGMVLTIRSGLLLGWGGFVRGRPKGGATRQSIEAVAVPLGAPSLFHEPCRCAVSYFGRPPDGGSEIDHRLWTLLGTPVPGEIGVHPVHVFGNLSCVLYVQTEAELPAAAAGGLAELGQALCAALERLVRADER
ncbi:MAG TPA: hypothetical protein VFU21_32385 [Kofleriaceae bacterium]|nr:hypothetical protein [Kofleriaceae bacterium]